MSPEKPTPQHDDAAREYNGLAEILYEAAREQGQYTYTLAGDLTDVTMDGSYDLVQLAQDVIDALKGYGYELTKRVEPSELGVTKGLPELAAEAGIRALNHLVAGLAPEVPPLPSKAEGGFQHAGQEVGRSIAGALEPLAPGAAYTAETGLQLGLNAGLPNAPQWVKQLLGQHDPLAAALDLIGRRTDIVAVQLPEPEPPRVPGSFPCWELAVGNVLLDSTFNEILVEGLTLSPRHAGELAAALLAAKAIAEASDGTK